MRWHSFQNGERPEWCKVTIRTPDFKQDAGTLLASMSCGQLQVSSTIPIQKVELFKWNKQ